MKKLIYFLSLALFLIFSSCSHTCSSKAKSPCIKEKIKAFKTDVICDSPFRIVSYTYQNETVYVFEEGNCGEESFSKVMDSECNFLGNLTYSPDPEIKGSSFEEAVLIETIWVQE